MQPVTTYNPVIWLHPSLDSLTLWSATITFGTEKYRALAAISFMLASDQLHGWQQISFIGGIRSASLGGIGMRQFSIMGGIRSSLSASESDSRLISGVSPEPDEWAGTIEVITPITSMAGTWDSPCFHFGIIVGLHKGALFYFWHFDEQENR